MKRQIFAISLLLFSFLQNSCYSQDVYDHAFNRTLMKAKGVKSATAISSFENEREWEIYYFDKNGNNYLSKLYSSFETDTVYFVSLFRDTLQLKEYLFGTENILDTTIIAIYKYDRLNRLKTKEEHYLNHKNGISQILNFEYDSLGKIKKLTINNLSNEIILLYMYDEKNRVKFINQSEPRVVSHIEYEYLENKVIRTSFLRSNGSESKKITSVYDENNNIINEKHEFKSDYPFEFIYEYSDGLLSKTINPDGSFTNIEYDYWK